MIVTIIENSSYPSFYVNGIQVDTINIYTYFCNKCKSIDNCNHTEAVKKYVERELDEYCKNHIFEIISVK
jgi:hypothetical protein